MFYKFVSFFSETDVKKKKKIVNIFLFILLFSCFVVFFFLRPQAKEAQCLNFERIS